MGNGQWEMRNALAVRIVFSLSLQSHVSSQPSLCLAVASVRLQAAGQLTTSWKHTPQWCGHMSSGVLGTFTCWLGPHAVAPVGSLHSSPRARRRRSQENPLSAKLRAKLGR
ncbi:hypothetical protein F4780DRAFT_224862 [Xylariomycetidae sp. FL0641]|nr:hypothetical protein F4780DRAFT_224862 [Xylariomycetidae sp. FL0641]